MTKPRPPATYIVEPYSVFVVIELHHELSSLVPRPYILILLE